MNDTTEITGTVSRVLYSSADTYWTVLSLQPDVEGEGPAIEGVGGYQTRSGGPITVVGTMAGVRENERLAVTGHFETDPRRGLRFKMERYRIALPATREGIERYLASGLLPGIGPKTAELLVKRFGDQTLEVIRRAPERLRTVKGVGQKKVAEIVRAFKEHAGYAELLAYLQGVGVSLGLAKKIHTLWGDAAVGKLRANPWLLADELRGVGFTKADAIAAEMGLGGEHPERTAAAVVHLLDEARRDGHCALPEADLLSRARALLNVEEPVVRAALATSLIAGRVVSQRLTAANGEAVEFIYRAELYRAECRVARRLRRLLTEGGSAETLTGLAVAEAEATLGMTLTAEQREAVRMSLEHPVVVITGGPGTGKTTIVRAVVSAFRTLGKTLALGAPTGRAAKRLQSATQQAGVADARTLHRLLEWQPAKGGFTRDEDNPVDASVVIVDEVSMVDLALMDALLRALRPGTRLILVGDADQLPSVGPGAVLADLIASGVIPVAALSQIHRQGKGSLIAENAHRILAGQLPLDAPADSEKAPTTEPGGADTRSAGPASAEPGSADTRSARPASAEPGSADTRSAGPGSAEPGSGAEPSEKPSPVKSSAEKGSAEKTDFYWIRKDSPEDILAVLGRLLTHRIPSAFGLDPRQDVQVLTPQHRGPLGSEALNRALRDLLNPGASHERGAEPGVRDGRFTVGDKVMQTRNNYDKETYNGDVGFVVEDSGGVIRVAFDESGREVTYAREEQSDLLPAWAISIHKSQGSEYPAVVLVLHTGHHVMLRRNLVYTALTRGRRLVVLLGPTRAMERALSEATVAPRYSGLAERLRQGEPPTSPPE